MFVSHKTNLPVLQRAVASTWFRGAITGLEVLNVLIAVWEMAHFNQSIEMLREKDLHAARQTKNAGLQESRNVRK